ncbi:Endonuclease/exonuclease/phosphatase [Apiospora hydei]|uniref:Endonuclease/exonuclease/phosphatase n=1 Tax=Apiospora hydei TaxID=1337664 RepID=A0ABR1XEG2_9PEZI
MRKLVQKHVIIIPHITPPVSSMNRSISPPPLKRQKRSQTASGTAGTNVQPVFSPPITPTLGTLRIFSWNVNGIAPFVQPYLNKSIKLFFGAKSLLSSERKRRRDGEEAGVDVITDSDSNGDVEGPAQGSPDSDLSKEGEPSLRQVLRRYGWPQVLFLQEVKIKPGDEKTQNAVRVAVNDARPVAPERAAPRSEATGEDAGSSQAAILADGGPGYDLFFNLPADPHNAKGFGGKVYGVAAIIRRDFTKSHVNEVRDVTWDREGRVQIIETRDLSFPLGDHDQPSSSSSSSSKTTKLALFNIYGVNGTTNAYRSTSTGAPAGTRHDRKLAFHADLLREARALESRGYAVIIAGDLNVAPDKRDGHPRLRTFPAQHVRNREDFRAKFLRGRLVSTAPNQASYKRLTLPLTDTQGECGEVIAKGEGDSSATPSGKMPQSTTITPGLNGIDTFRHVHADERRYSYHSRGRPWGSSCDRVDLIVASRALEKDIVNAGICDSPRDRGPSDHCPVWVEIGRPSCWDWWAMMELCPQYV